MGNRKHPFITGYMVFQCRGENLEEFLNLCLNKGIKLGVIKPLARKVYEIRVGRKDLSSFQLLCEANAIEYKILEKKGIPYLFKAFLSKKEVLLASVFSLFILVFLSNLVWGIEIEGLPEELEEKVHEQIKNYGIEEGRLSFNIPESSIIQQQLINDIPELLWIGVEKKGTSLLFKGVEKLSIQKDEPGKPRDLIAKKDAIVKDLFVIKGLSVVNRNDFVKEEDLLISGTIQDEENEKIEPVLVAAEGEVIGETWYEIKVTVPTNQKHEKLTGDYYEKTYLQLLSFKLATSFKKKKYKSYLIQDELTPIRFLLWDTPLYFKRETVYEVIESESHLDRAEAIKKGKKAALQSLNRQIGQNFRLKTNKVLQEAEENGKVNLILFVAIEENIAKSRPISQGD